MGENRGSNSVVGCWRAGHQSVENSQGDNSSKTSWRWRMQWTSFLLACLLLSLPLSFSSLQFRHFPITNGRSDNSQIFSGAVVRPTGRPDIDITRDSVDRDPAQALRDLLQGDSNRGT